MMVTQTRVFVGSGATFTAEDNGLALVGSSGTDTVRLQAGVTGTQMDANIERVEYSGNLSNYKFVTTANGETEVQDTSGAILQTFSSLNNGTTLAFADGSAPLKQTGATDFELDGHPISKTTASGFLSSSLAGFSTSGTSTSGTGTTTGTGATGNRVFLGAGNTFTVGDNNDDIIGAGGTSKDIVRLKSGVTGTKMDANIDRIELAGNLASYKFIAAPGKGVEIEDASGTVITTIPSLNQNSTVAFADGSASLTQSGTSTFALGGQTLSNNSAGGFLSSALTNFNTTDTSTLANGGSAVAVSAAGSSSAAGGNFTYNIAVGQYTYTISGFGAGDKIVGPTGASINIVPNVNTTDGTASFQFTDPVSQQTATVTLTGLTPAQDAAIYNVPSFNTLFGAGSIG